jgi:hypothetical protein
MLRTGVVILLAGTLAASALADTYVRVEKDGTKTYSDRPLPGGQRIDVTPAQTYSTPESDIPTSTATSRTRPAEEANLARTTNFRYTSCTVTPANDATFTNPPSVTVGVSTVPPLRIGDEVTLTVDGVRVGGPTTTSHVLQPIFRGAHTVAARISNSATVLCSATATFHVFRPSLLSPARPRS